MTTPLPTGATIGILGGGQLGRMLALAAARLGFTCHIFDPAPGCPAAQVSDQHTAAPYGDEAALQAFAKAVDVVTYEFENIPTDALDTIEALVPIHPNRKALATSQDRLTEKQFLQDLGLTPAPFANVESLADLETAAATIGLPAILKTRRFGYDGKGQVRLTADSDLAEAFAAVGNTPAVLEGFIDFSAEISVIGARAADGQIACFDPGLNVHKDGILDTTTVPSGLPARLTTDAVLIAAQVLNALDYVGVIGVELFVTPQGLIVNEFAPRVHNSGHWTQLGTAIDQFEQHIRAIAGWPLGDGQRHRDVEMRNLIGDDINQVTELRQDGRAQIHLYGKAEARAGRKMGHVNRLL